MTYVKGDKRSSFTFLTYTFGCRVNEAEMEALSMELSKRGFSALPNRPNLPNHPNHPNLYIINTCAVTRKAEREARQKIYQTLRKYPQTTVIVTGCSATKWINEKKSFGKRVLLIDNKNKDYLADLLVKNLSIVSGLLSPISVHLSPVSNSLDTSNKFLSSGRAFIKIQDGCNRFCSFCIVPYLRGLPKSIPINSVIRQINSLPKNIKEVTLTAVNTDAYGVDTGETFQELIQKVFTKVKDKKIGFGSIHPWSVTDEFIAWYKKNKDNPRLIHYFHIPLQSGSNTVLTRMKRNYRIEELEDRINKLHIINPNLKIGTDIIVGYLGETDQEFKQTYDFLARSPISKFHVFRFSPREHTAAWYMKNRFKSYSPTVIRIRSQKLIDLGRMKEKNLTE
jgi:threonylcarbamoyladenosine tRNA methylthiotransferase MtaB